MDVAVFEVKDKEVSVLIESTSEIESKIANGDEKVVQETEDNKMDVDTEDSSNKDESKLETDTNVSTLNSSTDSPTVIVQESTTRSGNFVKPLSDAQDSGVIDNSGYILYKSMKDNCKAVEEQAMDFISEIHHPAISCFREITRADFNNVIQNLKSSTESTELEQCIILIGMMDYIAVSLKNPLYYENFAKIQTCVHGCIKKLFLELRRILKEWADTDFAGFSKANDLIIKYLRGLEHYFKIINFDESFKSALQLLSKEANRYRRNKASKNRPNPFEERLALMEIANKSFEEKKDKKETGSVNIDKDRDNNNDDDDFKCLDVPPPKNISAFPPAPVFLKSQHNTNKKTSSSISKSAELMKQFCDSAKLNGIKNENKVNTLKRPATESSEINPAIKKVCTSSLSTKKDEKSPTPLSTPSSDSVTKSISSVSSTSPSKTSSASVLSTQSPQKSTVNAFMLMMNKSRELAKAGAVKTKKDNVKTPKTPKSTALTTKVK